ncbi:cell adhesion molecule Dscam1-like [Brevipalpus obovatus]|uniref:cell adhesion molecule Dscam1-like n=1 Tax=Brevipalpus obovatus TaxID=246614 RepID=UPI003D9E87E7
MFTTGIHHLLHFFNYNHYIFILISSSLTLCLFPQSSSGIEVEDEYVSIGSTAVFRCNIPSSVRDQLIVTAWIEEPNKRVIQPLDTHVIHHHDFDSDNRYIMLPSGELYIHKVDHTLSSRNYRCRVRDRSSSEIFTSNPGKLVVTESHNSISPRVSDIRSTVIGFKGQTGFLPCAAQGIPDPSYTWIRKDLALKGAVSYRLGTSNDKGSRLTTIGGILVIHDLRIEDSGTYVCRMNNSAGEERAETVLKVYAPLSAKLVPSREPIDFGSSILLNCSVTGHPVDSIIWEKDHKPISVDLPDQNEYGSRLMAKDLLYIESMEKKHKGVYQCTASNDHESVKAIYSINIRDDPPEFRETFNSETLEPGLSLSLKCVAAGNPLPQITWTLDGLSIPESHRIRFGDFVTKDSLVVSYVNISDLQVEDGGEYKCKADNAAAEVEHNRRINVIGPPLVKNMANRTVIAGENVIINCPVAGYPIEAIIWEKGGQRLPNNHRQKVYDNGTLGIHQVESGIDEDLYACIARNKEGKNSRSTLYIAVKIRPSIANFFFQNNLRESQRASVLCTVTSGDYPIKTKWLKNNVSIDDPGIKIQQLSDYSSILLFESLTLNQKGDYTCIVSNDAGTATHTAHLSIHVPPRWVIEPGGESSVVRGRSLSVDCQAEGFPIPRIGWNKGEGNPPHNYKSIMSNPHLQVYENGSLTIQEVQDSDAGSYLCQASNSVGIISKVVTITVHVAAHFKSRSHEEIIRKGEEVKLVCEAFGDMPITTTWTKGNQKIENLGTSNSVFGSFGDQSRITSYQITEIPITNGLSSSIVIKNADRSDSALFTCLAQNFYGEDKMQLHLAVQEPPDPPQDLQIVEITSRSVKLAWSAPYRGNSPITAYYILYHSVFAGESKSENVTVSSEDESFGEVRSLRPAQTYSFRLIAENRIGRSEPGKSVEVVTEEEAPEGPPLKVQVTSVTSRSVKVTWKPPLKEFLNGALKGYYIGYKQISSSASSSSSSSSASPSSSSSSSSSSGSSSSINSNAGTFIYKTLTIGDNFREEAIIQSLKRFTKYVIVIQAFNNKGAGPSSEEVYVQTLEMDVPNAPQMHVTSTSSSSIYLSWELTSDDHNPIEGYVLYQRVHSKDTPSNDWREINLKGHQTFHAASNLSCGTRHQFYLIAYNKAGKGKASEVVTVKTDGSAPVAPYHQSIISANTTAATVHLKTWHDGGCPISGYSIRYRLKLPGNGREDQQQQQQGQPQSLTSSSDHWHEVSIENPSKSDDIELSGLQSFKKYQIQVSATNQVGTTNADYTFITTNEIQYEMGSSSVFGPDHRRSSNRALSSSIPLQLSDYSIIISVIASVLVVVIISFLLCTLYRRIQYPARPIHHHTESLYSSMTGGVLGNGGSNGGTLTCNGDGIKSGLESNSNTLRLKDFPKCMRSNDNNGMETLPKVNCDTLGRKGGGTMVCTNLHHSMIGHRTSDTEPLYATVKRTPRVARSEAHIYNYPLIPSSAATMASSIASNNNDSIMSGATSSETFTGGLGGLSMGNGSGNGLCNCESKDIETKLIDHGMCPLLLDTL